MYSGLAVADYFVKRCLEENTPITNMAVLKMIYFAHGFCYAQRNQRLINDPFYAWQWGPVELHTYRAFKSYGGNPIQFRSGSAEDDLARIESDTTGIPDFLNTFIPLARVNPFNLSEESHRPGSPWAQTDPYCVIEEDVIRNYFTQNYGGTNR